MRPKGDIQALVAAYAKKLSVLQGITSEREQAASELLKEFLVKAERMLCDSTGVLPQRIGDRTPRI